MDKRDLPFCALAAGLVTCFVSALASAYPGYFWTDDYQTQYLAGFFELAEAARNFELPFLSRYLGFGGALTAEYQYAALSVPFQAINLIVWSMQLSLAATASVIVLVHLLILVVGTYLLARQSDLAPEYACFAALATALSGWVIQFAARTWVPALISFAWLPWAWWSLRLDESNSLTQRTVYPAFFAYCVLASGWPFTVAMLVVVVAWEVSRRAVRLRSLRPLLAPCCGLMMGALLAAPALLSLWRFFQTTRRGGFAPRTARWSVPAAALLNVLLPTRNETWLTFHGAQAHAGIELFCGLPPVVVLVTLVAQRRWTFLRQYAWEVLLLVFVFVLATQDSGLASFRFSFRWLPLFHLVFALLAAAGLSLILEPPRDPSRKRTATRLMNNLGFVSTVALSVVAISTYQLGRDAFPKATLGLLVISLLWMTDGLLRRPKARATLASLVIGASTVCSHYFFYEHDVPIWHFTDRLLQSAPLDQDRRYLSVFSPDSLYFNPPDSGPNQGATIRPGNTAAFAHIRTVGGYSPTGPRSVLAHFGFGWSGFLPPDEAKRILRTNKSTHALELFGIDGVVLSRDYAFLGAELPVSSWQLVAETQEALVYHRQGARSPAAYITSAESAQGPGLPDDRGMQLARVESIEEGRNHVRLTVSNPSSREQQVVFRRPWFPDYGASLNGAPQKVSLTAQSLPTVTLPPHFFRCSDAALW